MYNPFFDASALTVRELYEKIDEVSIRLSNARQHGMSMQIQETMSGVIMACQAELENRIAAVQAAEMKKTTCVFDTDEYLDNIERKEKRNDRKRKSKFQPGW